MFSHRDCNAKLKKLETWIREMGTTNIILFLLSLYAPRRRRASPGISRRVRDKNVNAVSRSWFLPATLA